MLGRSQQPGSDQLSIISITDLSRQGEREGEREVINVTAAHIFRLGETNAAITGPQQLV